MSNQKVALVTGANRGIGFEISRQLAEKDVMVIVAARNENNGREAVDQIKSNNFDAVFLKLEVTNLESINHAVAFVNSQFGKLDILVNNAGIILNNADTSTLNKADLLETLETNFFAPFLLSQLMLPLLKKSKDGRIINLSSGMGALSEMGTGHAAYRLSKTSLNGLTTAMAADLSNTKIKVNSMCPGWVRTQLGGDSAPKSPEQGAETAVWLALNKDVPTGKFFRDQKVIAW